MNKVISRAPNGIIFLRSVFSIAILLLLPLILYLDIFTQEFDGTYKGRLSGEQEGTFEFTVTGNYIPSTPSNPAGKYNLTGKIDSIVHHEIFGYVESNGKISGRVVDKSKGVNYKFLDLGVFNGYIKGSNASGEWALNDVPNTSGASLGKWSTGSVEATGDILSCTYKLGHELPLLASESRPVALRLSIKLADAYWSRFSIASILLGFRNPLPGRYAADIDSGDNFYIYTDEDALILNPELHAKEATFELPFVDFGVKTYLTMPKYFTTNLHVKLKSEIGEGDRTEKLEIPIQINSLFTVETIRCRRDAMPIFKGAKLPREQPMKGSSRDELVLPPDAGIQVKFLDGTAVVYFNRDDVKWTLTMGAGKFLSTDTSRFVTNAYEINAMIDQGLVKGAGSASDKAAEKGLEILLRTVAARSTTGIVIKIALFFSASKLGGEKLAVRLRSRVGVSLNKDGRIVVRNFAGAPEILSPGKPPLKIPVGFQAVVARGGIVRPPEPYPAGDPSVLVWSGDAVSQPLVVPADNVRSATGSEKFTGTWQGTWSNNLGENGADSLVLTEGPGGNLAGTWSGTILVNGRRSGPAAMTLQGRTSTRSYQINGTIRGNVLSLRYIVSRLDRRGTYNGQSTLTLMAAQEIK
jgi:hypothetical protein